MSEVNHLTLLEAALDKLLPEGVMHATGPIPEKAQFHYQLEKDSLRTAGDYRQREFVAGRDCARLALERLGFVPGPILADGYGVPLWPEGALAAISHSRGYCASIAGKRSEYRILGLDLEKTNRLSRSAISRVVHPNEQNYVESDQKKASLLFSAKEAFFKAQFPIWHTHGNFHDLELQVHPESGELKIQNIGERFPDELRALAPEIQFRFSFFEDFVVTACWL